MNVVEIIKKKRDCKNLSLEEIKYLVDNYTKGVIPDYQFSSFLMAAFINGLSVQETSYLTNSMLNSGKIVDLSDIEGVKVDKHSTGGVGDKTSLIIAPAAAAAGVLVPMISGRGLGHTGGTLDKLESIPGFRTNLDLDEYKKVLKKCGAVMIGQTEDIAPADKLIYALRDVTGTVESIPFITASIMSKKLAEGIDGLVLDVKTGSGAFMDTIDKSFKLAESLIDTAIQFDKKVTAFITDMNQPLGNYIGNWFEVYESVKVLKGELKNDLFELSSNLTAAMLKTVGKVSSLNEGKTIFEKVISDGSAYEKFLKMVELQGGSTAAIENLENYPKSSFSYDLKLDLDGFVESINNYEIGMAALELGAGRLKKDDVIDYKAGIIFNKKIGDEILGKDIVCTLFSDSKSKIQKAAQRIISAVKISDYKISKVQLIKNIL